MPEVHYKRLKVGQKYFITQPETEVVTEVILKEISLGYSDENTIIIYFTEHYKDEKGEDYTTDWKILIKDGKRSNRDKDEYTEIVPYLTREEAEKNRLRLLKSGYLKLIKSYQEDIAEVKEKLKNLR